MIRYRRDVPANAIDVTVAHIRAHLSSVADPDDDPFTRADDVVIITEPHDSGLVSIIGMLDARPNAPYLRSDYQPDQDHTTIQFHPYEQPQLGRFADYSALIRFRHEEDR